MKNQRILTVAALTLTLACPILIGVTSALGGAASAHHGRSGYDGDNVTLEGVVTQYIWRNPHVFVIFDVTDDQEEAVSWTGELSSVTTMLAAGMHRSSVKPGDEIVVTGRSAARGLPHSLLTEITKADGTVVLANNPDGGSFRQRTR